RFKAREIIVQEKPTPIVGFVAAPEAGQRIGHRHSYAIGVHHGHMGRVSCFNLSAFAGGAGRNLRGTFLRGGRVALSVGELIRWDIHEVWVPEVLGDTLVRDLPSG